MLWRQSQPQRPIPPAFRPAIALKLCLLLLALCTLLSFQAAALAQDPVFDYNVSNGTLPYPQFNFYGDATDFFPHYSEGIYVVPITEPDVPLYGSVYYNQQIDMSNGFEVALKVPFVSNLGFSIVIKSPSEPKFLNKVGQNGGYNGFKNSVAIDFDNINRVVRVCAPGSSGTLFQYDNVLGQAALIGNTSGGSEIGSQYAIRYSPKSRILDIYYNDKLILRIPNFHLDTYHTLVNNQAWIGIHSVGNSQAVSATFPPTEVDRFTFGNNLNSFGVGPSYYSQLFTFNTSGQNIWGTGSGSASWDYLIGTTYNKSYKNSTGSSGFSAKINASADNNGQANGIGLRFHAEANGGQANITYPLFLNLLFPKQLSIPPGKTFQIASSYEADLSAALTTTSPTALLQSYLNFNTHTQLDMGLGFPAPFDFLNFDTTFCDIKTITNDVCFFDTDYLIKNASLFGITSNAASTGKALYDLQDDEGVKGPKADHRGEKGTGTSKGASALNAAMAFLSLNLNQPNLAVNATVPYQGTPNQLVGSAQDTVLGIHADFTSGLLALAGFDILSTLMNFDYSFDFGAGNQYQFGLHMADLYGDLNFGMQMAHTFIPKPHVHLNFTDQNGNPIHDTHGSLIQSIDFDLNADGTPVDTVDIPMPNQPLVVQPTVTIYNPNYSPTNGQPTYNTFTTTPSLTIGGDIALDAFQAYAKIGSLADIDTGMIGYFYNVPSYVKPLTTIPDFQVAGFNSVTGPVFTLLPADSPHPQIVSTSPNRIFPVSTASGKTLLTLQTLNASTNSGILWDHNLITEEDLMGTFNVANDGTSVQIYIPNNLLTARGYHTLTLVNGYTNGNANQKFYSHSVTFTILQPAPTINALSPKNLVLTTPPVDANGSSVLITVNDPVTQKATANYFVLTVTGSNFVPSQTVNSAMMPGSVVNWNGQPLVTTVISPTVLTATVPSSLISLAGSANITVTTGQPGGGTSSTLTFRAVNPAPTAAVMSPATSFAGAKALSVTVTGTNFVSSSAVRFNGGVRPTTFVSSTRLFVQLNAADLAQAGTANISVVTGPLRSTNLTFSVGQSPARTILKIKPTFTRLGNQVTMTLTLTNIGSSDAVDLALSAATLSLGAQNFVPQLSGVQMPASLSTLPISQAVQVPGTFTFTAAGNTGDVRMLSISGSFSNGSFDTKLRVVLP